MNMTLFSLLFLGWFFCKQPGNRLWVRHYTLNMKILVDFTTSAKYSILESASNQTSGKTLYWQDQSTKHQKKYSSDWFAVINCGIPQISSNKNLVLFFVLESCVYMTIRTPCAQWLSSPLGLLDPTETPLHLWASSRK